MVDERPIEKHSRWISFNRLAVEKRAPSVNKPYRTAVALNLAANNHLAK